MGQQGQQVIDCRATQEVRPDLSPTAKCSCTNCGADFWHIRQNGEVLCADCDEPATQYFVTRNDS